MATRASAIPIARAQRRRGIIDRLNGEWHKPALLWFTAIVLAHWGEHLAQAFQMYVLNWPVSKSLGLLGLFYPWLVQSEILHYGYALVMLIGIWIFRRGFKGQSRAWWTAALVIQFWHHIEHLLLQTQAIVGYNLLGRPVPTSVVQIWIPRAELHLFYNTAVFLPMVVAMYYHMFPSPQDEAQHACTCAIHLHARAAA
jgi:hypothetical protein